MAKHTEIPTYMQSWKAEVLLAIVFLAASYGLISWALNSGRIIEYALGILFLISAVKTLIMAARTMRKH